MKKDKLLIGLVVGLALVFVVLFFIVQAKKKKAGLATFPLAPGSTGKAVSMLQAANGVPITATFDQATLSALTANAIPTTVTAKQFLDTVALAEDVVQKTPIANGSSNIYVTLVQIMLGVPTTGIFDATTATALQGSIGENVVSSYNDYRNLITKTIGI